MVIDLYLLILVLVDLYLIDMTKMLEGSFSVHPMIMYTIREDLIVQPLQQLTQKVQLLKKHLL